MAGQQQKSASKGPEAERSQSAATLEEAMALNEKNALAEAKRITDEGEDRVETTRAEYEEAVAASQPAEATGVGDTGAAQPE